MSTDVQTGLLQIGLAGSLFYAWWSGALALLTSIVIGGLRNKSRTGSIGDLSDALGVTTPSPASQASVVAFPAPMARAA